MIYIGDVTNPALAYAIKHVQTEKAATTWISKECNGLQLNHVKHEHRTKSDPKNSIWVDIYLHSNL
jgi:hypothetical protein